MQSVLGPRKSPHPPFGYLLPCEDAREKAHFICLLPFALANGRRCRQADEGSLVSCPDQPMFHGIKHGATPRFDANLGVDILDVVINRLG